MFLGTNEALGLKSLQVLDEYCLSVVNNVDYPAIRLFLNFLYNGKDKG